MKKLIIHSASALRSGYVCSNAGRNKLHLTAIRLIIRIAGIKKTNNKEFDQ